MNYPFSLKQLIECFKKLPGIGEKTAERLSLAIINMDDDIINNFSNSMLNVKYKIKTCKICNGLTENEVCDICNDKNRDIKKICVVSDAKDIFLFEKIGTYNGKYFVLSNLIEPIKGISPNDINFDSLFKLINDNEINELILALKPSLEGETTSLYISKKIANKNLLISKIAQGIPLGAEMEFIDPMTIELAFENRKPI